MSCAHRLFDLIEGEPERLALIALAADFLAGFLVLLPFVLPDRELRFCVFTLLDLIAEFLPAVVGMDRFRLRQFDLRPVRQFLNENPACRLEDTFLEQFQGFPQDDLSIRDSHVSPSFLPAFCPTGWA